jgi:carboxypeptidase family protein
MRSRAAGFVVFAIVGLLAVPVRAQITQGRLTGLVADAQGAVLPGVTVTATSPSLIGVQTTVTQPDGRFLFPALPSGTYRLVFELGGFQKLTRENVQVVLGQTISVDAQLPIASLAESVTVTGASPVIDVTTTKVGTNLKGEALVAVPNSTDLWGALSESPGVRMQGFDVGGSHKSQQSGYEVFGVQNQARVVSDGVDHTEGVGGTGFYEDYYANEEVSVSALGSDVEMNSPGAAIVTTIKSGANTFKGLEHFSYEPGKFVGTNAATTDIKSRGYTCPTNNLGAQQCGNPNILFYEGHADLGGPIAANKAWFYGAYNHFKINKEVAGVSRVTATDIGIFDNLTGKATLKGGEANTFIGYIQFGRKQKPFRGLSNLVPLESVRAQDSKSYMGKGEWQRVITNRAFFDVNVGAFHLNWPMVVQVDPATRVPEIERATTAVRGAGWNAFTTSRWKPQLIAKLTYYLPEKAGSHDLKFGFEDLYDYYRFGINGTSGPYRLSYSTFASGVASRIRFADIGAAGDFGSGWSVSPNVDQHYSGYAQDRWALNNRLTITGGVRIDYQDLRYGDSTRKPLISDVTGPLQAGDGGRIFPASTTVTGKSLLTNTDISARVGVTVNLTGDGKTVLKGFYGRYYNNIADGFSAANPGGTNYIEYNFNDVNRNGRYDGPQELGTFRFRLGGADAPVDPKAKTPYTDEFSGTIERQFWEESSVRATYVRKHQAQFLPFYYTPIVTAWLQPTNRVTVPVKATASNGVTYNLLDVPDSLADSTGTMYTNWPDGTFNYDTIELAFRKRVSAKLFVESSFDYQWRNELRSADIDNTGSNSPLSTDPIGVFPQISVNPNAPNRQKTTMYHLQLAGRYTFPYDVGFAANYRFQSGFPYSFIVPDGDVPLNVCNFQCSFFSTNLDQNRSEAVNLLNFRFDKSFPVGRSRITAMLDWYNVLNADPITNFNLVGDGFKKVIATLDPRVFQVGFRFEF